MLDRLGLNALLCWGLMPIGGLLAVAARREAFTLRVERDGTLRGAAGEAGATPLAA